jgi:hypothetical protein
MFETFARYRALSRFLRSRRPADANNPIPANDNRADALRAGRARGRLRCQWHAGDGGRGLAMRWRPDNERPPLNPVTSRVEPRAQPAEAGPMSAAEGLA